MHRMAALLSDTGLANRFELKQHAFKYVDIVGNLSGRHYHNKPAACRPFNNRLAAGHEAYNFKCRSVEEDRQGSVLQIT